MLSYSRRRCNDNDNNNQDDGKNHVLFNDIILDEALKQVSYNGLLLAHIKPIKHFHKLRKATETSMAS